MQSFILIGWKVSGSSILDFFVFFCFLWTSLQWFTLENLLPSYILKYRHHINRNIKGSHLIFKKVDYWVTCFTFFLKCPGRGQVKRNVLLFFKQSKTYISHWQTFLKFQSDTLTLSQSGGWGGGADLPNNWLKFYVILHPYKMKFYLYFNFIYVLLLPLQCLK